MIRTEDMVIDVVIPAYNAGPFLGETLASVAAQKTRPNGVIVVDDSSTDNTAAIAHAFAEEQRGRIDVRVLRNAGPRGPSAARNTGIKAGSAPLIALLDADDVLAPDHHTTLFDLMHRCGDAVLAFGNSTVFDHAGTRIPDYLSVSGVPTRPAREIAPGCFTFGDRMFSELLRHGIFGTSACLFRRDAAIDVGLFDEGMSHAEDTDFFLRLSLVSTFVFSPSVIAHKRVHEDNLSHDRHKLAFCRGTSRSLMNLALSPPGELRPDQYAALQAALYEALQGYLYHASRESLAAYRDAARLARRAGHALMAAHPKHLARVAFHAVL